MTGAKIAVVSGLSVSGMLSAALLAHAGYRVLGIDKRTEPTRGIQWAGRQSFIDELSRIDPSLATRFRQRCGPIYRGSTRVRPDGIREVKAKPFPRSGDPARIPPDVHVMLDEPASFLVAAVELEKLLRGYLRSLPNVTLSLGAPIRINEVDATTGRVILEGGLDPDLLVIAEGQASRTRDELGIKTLTTSPARLQIAGQVLGWDDGSMVKRLRHRGSTVLETGSISQRGRGSTWVVGDATIDHPPGSRRGISVRAGDPHQVRRDFVRMAADILGASDSHVLRRGVWGPSRQQAQPQVFRLQQRISQRAAAARNAILIGDAVGNGHWNEGGGMQVAAICHTQHLRRLLASSDSSGALPDDGLATYSNGVLADTSAWGERGVASFFPTAAPEAVVASYRRAVQDFHHRPSTLVPPLRFTW